ncbi:thioredoxin-disulfide reductase activity [Bonamia ostreae]|uniref:Thioredoxin-disulfide reductase activity n=1 Tax=Bonamia ostreae TaxID=126728 RepID=A0ABV2AIY9_9EUKA
MNTQLKKTFDVIVIGGGSGGIACARECAKLGANVAIFDFVKPSPFGSKWGLGGTCVNVGCIPKKLMHYSSILGSKMDHARTLGWNINGNDAVVHKWDKMVEAVQCHLKSLNFGYRVDLMKNKVTYLNSFARFKDRKSIEYEENGVKKELMAEKIVLAVGGRPKFPKFLFIF